MYSSKYDFFFILHRFHIINVFFFFLLSNLDSLNELPFDTPVPICKSECILVNQGCQAFFDANHASIDCNQIDPLTSQPQWPDAADLTPPAACFTFSELNITGSAEYNCPPPLVFAAPDVDPNTGLPCSTTCHYKLRQPVQEPKEVNFDDQFVVFSVLNWISFVASIITVLVYSLFPDNHDYPRNVNIILGCCIILLHLGWVGNSFRSPDEQWCKSKFAIDPNSDWCIFQSWTTYFAALAIIGYWIFGAVIMFWDIALLRYHDYTLKKLTPFIHFAILSYALTASLILVFVPDDQAGGYSPGYIYCLLGPSYDYKLFYGLYAWPFYIGIIIIVISCASSMIRLYYLGSGEVSILKTFKKHIRLQLTILLFMMVWLSVAIAFIAISKNVSQKEQIIQSNIKWYECVFTIQSLTTDCPDPIGDVADVTWWSMMMFSIVGLLYSIIFLLVNPTQQHIFKNAWRNYQAGIPIFVRRSPSSQTSRRSTSSSHRSTSTSSELKSIDEGEK
jgi:hypothetical protein